MLTFLNESLAAVKFFFLIAESNSFETPRLRYGNRKPQLELESHCPGERSVHFLSLGFSICRVCRNGQFGPINSKLRRNATASSNPTLSAIQSLMIFLCTGCGVTVRY